MKGANGVILITTKRGQEGKANVQVKANMTAKVVSKLPEKYDAYDTFYLMNNSIEREAASTLMVGQIIPIPPLYINTATPPMLRNGTVIPMWTGKTTSSRKQHSLTIPA